MKQGRFFVILLMLVVFKKADSQEARDTLVSVYFSTNSYALDSAQRAQLATIASSATSVKQVTGYADRRGTESYNWQLSQKRAAAVMQTFVSFPEKLKGDLLYKGEQDTPYEELWRNRRVDILFTLPAAANGTTETTLRTLNLDNIYFVPDSAVIAPQSVPLIKDLAKALENYQGEYFQIIGHANCQQTLDPSKIKNFYRLSEQRAKLIYLLLIEQGIPAEKLSYKGIANTLPAVEDPKSVEEKKMNMRVQILITKKG